MVWHGCCILTGSLVGCNNFSLANLLSGGRKCAFRCGWQAGMKCYRYVLREVIRGCIDPSMTLV